MDGWMDGWILYPAARRNEDRLPDTKLGFAVLADRTQCGWDDALSLRVDTRRTSSVREKIEIRLVLVAFVASQWCMLQQYDKPKRATRGQSATTPRPAQTAGLNLAGDWRALGFWHVCPFPPCQTFISWA